MNTPIVHNPSIDLNAQAEMDREARHIRHLQATRGQIVAGWLTRHPGVEPAAKLTRAIDEAIATHTATLTAAKARRDANPCAYPIG